MGGVNFLFAACLFRCIYYVSRKHSSEISIENAFSVSVL